MEAQRRKLRKSNIGCVRPHPSEFKSLDGSIKKNSSFIKKLKTSLTKETLPQLSAELLSLKLEKYLEEIVVAITDNPKLKQVDVIAALEISSLLNQRFADFAQPALQSLLKQLGPPPMYPSGTTPEQKEKEEASRISKEKIVLRLLTELYLVGVFTEDEQVICTTLRNMLIPDKNYLLNLPIAVYFVKCFGTEFFGPTVKEDGDEAEKFEPIVSDSVRNTCKEIFMEYYQSAEKILFREHKRMKKVEANNHEFFIARGEVTEDRQEKYERGVKILDKILASCQSLSQGLGLKIPEFPKEDSTTRIDGIGIVDGTTKEEKNFVNEIWEDGDSKAFYEDIVDLKNFVPAIFLTDKKVKASDLEKEDSTVVAKGEVKESDEMDAVVESGKNEEVNAEDVKVSAETITSEEFSEEPEQKKNSMPLENLLVRLAGALNRDIVDQISSEFCYLNNKGARKRLISCLIGVPRQRLDIIPYYCRLVATLNPYFPDIASALLEALEKDFHYHLRKKNQIFIDEKIKNIRYIGELTKFRITPNHLVFHCFKLLLDDFSPHSIEVLSNLLENCGRFLFKSPETSVRTANMLETMMRKKNVQHLDNRQNLMIENAFYQCNPPDRPAIMNKVRPPLQMFFRKLLFEELSKKSVEKIARLFRRLNWDDSETVLWIHKLFCKIWKVKYSHVSLMAFMVGDISRYYPEFAVAVTDQTLENIRIELESNLFKHNQRRISTIKYLGELYNYRVIESNVIFDTLYLLIRFGHEGGIAKIGGFSPLDAPLDFFRVRLCCTLLDSCAGYFNQGKPAKQLDQFLLFFQLYILSKNLPSMEIQYLIEETFEYLRPNMQIYKSHSEVVAKISEISLIENLDDNKEAVVINSDPDDDDGEDMDDEGSVVSEDESDSEVDYDDDNVSDELDADDSVIVHVESLGKSVEDQEADADFEREFSSMMQESLESRKYDRKPAAFDIAIPSKSKGVYDREENIDSSSESQVAFTFLTRKGAKQQSKTMALPANSTFAMNTKHKQDQEKEEKLELKKLVLKSVEDETTRKKVKRTLWTSSQRGRRRN